MPVCPTVSRIPSGRRFTCLPLPSCAGTGLRSLVADFLPRARLDALELLREEELTAERDAGAGGCLDVWDVQSYVL